MEPARVIEDAESNVESCNAARSGMVDMLPLLCPFGETIFFSVAVTGEEVEGEEEKHEECKFTPEEKKLWETVQETPSDFPSWTQLLQLVEQRVGVYRSYYRAVIHMNTHTMAAPNKDRLYSVNE